MSGLHDRAIAQATSASQARSLMRRSSCANACSISGDLRFPFATRLT